MTLEDVYSLPAEDLVGAYREALAACDAVDDYEDIAEANAVVEAIGERLEALGINTDYI